MKIRVCQGPGCENEFEAYPSNKKYCSLTCKSNARYQPNDDAALYDAEPFVASYEEAFQEGLYDVPMPVPESDDELQRMEFLRRENTRLQRASEKYKNSSDEAFKVIADAIAKNVRSIKLPATRRTARTTSAPELVLNPWNSDTQIGKVTPSYNTDMAYERVERYTDRILTFYKEYSSEYNITSAHVWFLGDIVEGENIFPTQSHLIDTSVFKQATVDGPQIYGDQIRRLLEVLDRVVVCGVIGNHGRLGRYSNPESNMDRVLYQCLYWMFHEDPRVEFVIPQGHGESSFWLVDAIGEYSTLLVHGDQFGPPSTQNTYVRKIPSWRAGGIPIPFQDVAMGHYHQNVKFTIGDVVVRIGGSTESYNTFAQERLGVMGRPSQHLQMVDPTSGVYWETDVYLD